jgi:ubiquinone/menaquinone biosynthesis C-methylase UbiE
MRIPSFVATMHIKPTDCVLEIGCGHGIAAGIVCAMLTSGRYVGLDRSSKMIDAAIKRNAAHVRAGKARFILGSLETASPRGPAFDKVFAMRVGIFETAPEQARRLALGWLAENGQLFVEYDRP